MQTYRSLLLLCDTLCSDDLKPGDCELVVDEGRALQPCRYKLLHACLVLFSSYTAHNRAVGTDDTHVIHY